MPWSSGAEFAHRHNKKLSGAAAGKAKDIANAIIRRGGDEGVAIATANKYGNKMQAKRRKPQPEQATHYDSTVANWGSLGIRNRWLIFPSLFGGWEAKGPKPQSKRGARGP